MLAQTVAGGQQDNAVTDFKQCACALKRRIAVLKRTEHWCRAAINNAKYFVAIRHLTCEDGSSVRANAELCSSAINKMRAQRATDNALSAAAHVRCHALPQGPVARTKAPTPPLADDHGAVRVPDCGESPDHSRGDGSQMRTPSVRARS